LVFGAIDPRRDLADSGELMAMEDQIGALAELLKGMQSRMDQQHDSLRRTLEANTSALRDLCGKSPATSAATASILASSSEDARPRSRTPPPQAPVGRWRPPQLLWHLRQPPRRSRKPPSPPTSSPPSPSSTVTTACVRLSSPPTTASLRRPLQHLLPLPHQGLCHRMSTRQSSSYPPTTPR
jgi:hypothetical protein